ncbi:MAG TPA: hypothetical protein VFX61_23620 [Micromonosporaceae bacterium]|nr:hypothetical protein [Micromonosporaceae bacterium]
MFRSRTACKVGAHAVDLDLARYLLDQGARINACAISRALDNEDVEVMQLLARAVQPDEALGRLEPRLRMMATQTAIASRRATAQSDETTAQRQQLRSEVLAELADRFDPDRRP